MEGMRKKTKKGKNLVLVWGVAAPRGAGSANGIAGMLLSGCWRLVLRVVKIEVDGRQEKKERKEGKKKVGGEKSLQHET